MRKMGVGGEGEKRIWGARAADLRALAMKHIAAYMLCVLGGNANPSAADVKKVLQAAEANIDDGAIDKIVESLGGKSAEEVEALIKDGKGKMGSVGGGGGGGGGGGAAPAAAAASAGKLTCLQQERSGCVMFV